MSRAQLRDEICRYLTDNGVARSKLAVTIDKIKAASRDGAVILDAVWRKETDAGTRRYLKDLKLKNDTEFYWRVSWYFSTKHYAAIVGFIKAYDAILEAEYIEEYEISQALMDAEAEYEYYMDDECYRDGPDALIIVFSDRIEVKAYVSGMGNVLPFDGRRYAGSHDDIRWRYPLSSLEALKATGYPIVQKKIAQQ